MPKALSLAILALVTGIAGAQAPEWSSRLPLPRPTGRYPVATRIFHSDDSVTFPDGRRVARPVTAQAWYPARAGHARGARYVEDAGLLDAMRREKYLDLESSALNGWDELRLTARIGGSPARSPGRHGWPALVLSHGFGVSRINYAALAQELASRGYVVLTVDHPYGGFMVAPDGTVLQPGGDSLRRRLGSPETPATVDSALAWDARRWASEAAGVVRRVAARRTQIPELVRLDIDTTRVGMLGHSLGGAAALQACRDDAIFRACADMDGAAVGDVERQGVPKPMLVLLSQPAGSKGEPKDSAERAHREMFARMGRERDSTWRTIAAYHAQVPSFIVKLRGTGHFSFSDAPFQMPSQLRGTGSTLSARESYARIISRLTAFFDHFLRGAPLRLLSSGLTTVQ
jgi:dienelactone hydrolase